LELIKKQQHARAEAHKASEEAKKSTMAQLEASKLQIWKIAAVRSVFEQTPHVETHVACFLQCFAHMFFFRSTSFPSICIPLHGLSQQIALHHAELWTEARS